MHKPGWSSTFSDVIHVPTSNLTVNVSKAQKQWVKWTTTVIPSLLQPYLWLLRTTQSLHNLAHDQEVPCTCGRLNLRKMTVICLHFDGTLFSSTAKQHSLVNCSLLALKEETILTYHCSPALLVLLACSLFPCTPVAPSLAVDIKLLEFTQLQFLHLVPNTTGWCDATKSFLNALSFKLTTRVCLFLCDYLLID